MHNTSFEDVSLKDVKNTQMKETKMKEIAHEFKSMAVAIKGNQGINCIDALAFYLKCGDYESACAVAVNEWDKISSYGKIANYLIFHGIYSGLIF